MSRIVLLLLLMSAAPVTTRAQGVPALAAEVRRLELRVDTLRRGAEEARGVVVAAPAPGADKRQLDDLERTTVGRLEVMSDRTSLPVARGTELAWAGLLAYYGDTLGTLSFSPLVIQGVDPDSGHGALDSVADLTLSWDLPATEVAERIIDARAPTFADAPLVTWGGGALRPERVRPAAAEELYGQLLFSPYSAGRDCAGGELAACRAVLLLLPADAPLAAWYPTEGDRRQVALSLERAPHAPALAPLLEECLRGGVDSACAHLLEGLPPIARPSLVDPGVRRAFLRYALEQGGRGAFARLLTSAGRPVGDRLAIASGVPLDTLVARWQTTVVHGHHPTPPWSASMLLGGVVWIVGLALGALSSSRWHAV